VPEEGLEPPTRGLWCRGSSALELCLRAGWGADGAKKSPCRRQRTTTSPVPMHRCMLAARPTRVLAKEESLGRPKHDTWRSGSWQPRCAATATGGLDTSQWRRVVGSPKAHEFDGSAGMRSACWHQKELVRSEWGFKLTGTSRPQPNDLGCPFHATGKRPFSPRPPSLALEAR